MTREELTVMAVMAVAGFVAMWAAGPLGLLVLLAGFVWGASRRGR